MAGRTNVIRWPYLPRLAAKAPGTGLVHSGGSAVAWVRIVVGDVVVTSADPELIANSRLLIEQCEEESA